MPVILPDKWLSSGSWLAMREILFNIYPAGLWNFVSWSQYEHTISASFRFENPGPYWMIPNRSVNLVDSLGLVKYQAASGFPWTQLDEKILDHLPDVRGRNSMPTAQQEASTVRTKVPRGFYGQPYILHQILMAVANVGEASKTWSYDCNVSEIFALEDCLPCSTDKSVTSENFVENKGS